MKIGVLTYHRAHNYGAFLQAYALTKRLCSEGYDTEIIDFNMKKSERLYKMKLVKNPYANFYNWWLHKTFKTNIANAPMSKELFVSDSIEEFSEFVRGKYDIIIAGSDEIWRLDSGRGFPNPYWLSGDLGCIKMACAVSSRSDFSILDDNELRFVRRALQDFHFISVRDIYTKEQLSRYSDKEIALSCDPTFAFNFAPDIERGRALLRKAKADPNKKWIGMALSDRALVNALMKEFGNSIQIISLYGNNDGTINVPWLNPFEWVDAIAALDFFITSLFHGVCFAIQSNMPFIAIDSREKVVEHGKIYDLLFREGMLERFIPKKDSQYTEKCVSAATKALRGAPCDFTAVVSRERSLFKPFIEAINMYSLKGNNDLDGSKQQNQEFIN